MISRSSVCYWDSVSNVPLLRIRRNCVLCGQSQSNILMLSKRFEIWQLLAKCHFLLSDFIKLNNLEENWQLTKNYINWFRHSRTKLRIEIVTTTNRRFFFAMSTELQYLNLLVNQFSDAEQMCRFMRAEILCVNSFESVRCAGGLMYRKKRYKTQLSSQTNRIANREWMMFNA